MGVAFAPQLSPLAHRACPGKAPAWRRAREPLADLCNRSGEANLSLRSGRRDWPLSSRSGSGRRDWPLSSDESPRRARRTRSRTSSLQCPSGRCLWARGKASMRARSMRDLQGRARRPRRPPPSRRGRKRTGSSAGALLRSHEPRRTSIARPGAPAPSSTARASDFPTKHGRRLAPVRGRRIHLHTAHIQARSRQGGGPGSRSQTSATEVARPTSRWAAYHVCVECLVAKHKQPILC